MKTKNMFKILIISVLMLLGIQINLQALNYDSTSKVDTIQLKPSFFVGAALGGNFNFYQGSTQTINDALISYPPFHNGKGSGLYIAPTIVYHKANKLFGLMLQAGYDGRKGQFNQIKTICNCPADLKTDLSYLTIEPSLMVYPFKGNLYLYGGPRFAFNFDKGFTYNKGASLDGLTPAEPAIKGNFTNINSSVLSWNVGVGYDIWLASKVKNNKIKQVILSPFVDVHPYFGQNPRSIETWNLTTVRAGIVLKFGHVKVIAKQAPVVTITPAPVIKPEPKPEPTPVVVPVVVVPKAPTIIFFAFDKSKLNKQAISDLDQLVIELNQNASTVELKSYADIRGSVSYNIKLSERRGNAIVNYLISKGIKTSRINSKGLGETQEFNKNGTKNTESEYALNRRTNIIIVTDKK